MGDSVVDGDKGIGERLLEDEWVGGCEVCVCVWGSGKGIIESKLIVERYIRGFYVPSHTSGLR